MFIAVDARDSYAILVVDLSFLFCIQIILIK